MQDCLNCHQVENRQIILSVLAFVRVGIFPQRVYSGQACGATQAPPHHSLQVAYLVLSFLQQLVLVSLLLEQK